MSVSNWIKHTRNCYSSYVILDLRTGCIDVHLCTWHIWFTPSQWPVTRQLSSHVLIQPWQNWSDPEYLFESVTQKRDEHFCIFCTFAATWAWQNEYLCWLYLLLTPDSVIWKKQLTFLGFFFFFFTLQVFVIYIYIYTCNPLLPSSVFIYFPWLYFPYLWFIINWSNEHLAKFILQ